jgi:hypothetical protein
MDLVRRQLPGLPLPQRGSLRARRRTETVFGSGASLNEIAAGDWAEIARHDTFGFNWFVHERFVRREFRLIRGIPDTDRDAAVWRPSSRYPERSSQNGFFLPRTESKIPTVMLSLPA